MNSKPLLSREQILHDGLTLAILESDLPKARTYLKMGAPINPPSSDQVSILRKTIDLGKPRLIAFCLQNQANPNRRDPSDYVVQSFPLSRAIHRLMDIVDVKLREKRSVAVHSEAIKNAAAIIRNLVEAGANPHLKITEYGPTPASQLDMKLGDLSRKEFLRDAGICVAFHRSEEKSPVAVSDAVRAVVSHTRKPSNMSYGK